MSNFDGITVKQLREWLSEFPDDMIVVTNGDRSGYDNIFSPEIISVRLEDENNEFDGIYQITDEGVSDSFDVLAISRDNMKD